MRITPYILSSFVQPNSANPADLFTDAVFALLADVGVDRLTMRAVAGFLRVSPSALTQSSGGRDRFIETVVVRFGGRWRHWIASVSSLDELPVALPCDLYERHGVVVWAALRELARSEALAGRPQPLESLRTIDAFERTALAAELTRRIRRRPTEAEVDGLGALADGVRARMVDRASPLPLERARAVVLGHLASLSQPEAPR